MKQVADNNQAAVKPKTKLSIHSKAIKTTKPAEAKTSADADLKSVQLNTAKKTKIEPKTAPRLSPEAKLTTPKRSAKLLNTPENLLVRNAELSIKQTEKLKKSETATDGAAKPVEKSTLTAKTVTATAKPKTFGKPESESSIKTDEFSIKAAKDKSPKAALQIVKSPSLKVKTEAAQSQSAKIETPLKAQAKKFVSHQTESLVVLKKLGTAGKIKLNAVGEIGARREIAPKTPPEKIKSSPRKNQPTVAAKTAIETAEKSESVISERKVVRKPIEVEPEIEQTIAKTRKSKFTAFAAPVKKRAAKIENVIFDTENKLIENVVETIQARPAKPKNKKAKPIGSAVFRGKKERYDFKVFALNTVFEPIPAVYIISKRKTDKLKKGHHALICIGETVSIADELKRHHKGKCVKKHEANVVSILPEADVKTRLKIESDLRAAHAVACHLD